MCNYSTRCAVSDQVRALHGIPALVRLFSSDNQEVLRYATGAMRNVIYENADNKVVLIDVGGVTRLISILSEPDEELRKTITGLSAAYEMSPSLSLLKLMEWYYSINRYLPYLSLIYELGYSDNTPKTCGGCRYPMESVLQRQPEGETVQRHFIRADRESVDPSVP